MSLIGRRFAPVLLLLAVGQGCNRGALVAPAKQPQAGAEGETWSCADMAAYLQEQGTTLHVLGELSKANGDIPESVLYVDHKAALGRKKGNFMLDGLAEKKAGTGTILILCYRSKDLAHQQPRPSEESSLVWGRFIVVTFDARKGRPNDDNERSKKLIQTIRGLLGS
ncbi:MAG: hypothetical protein EXR98_19590 [Gemmataceae bacterium]|nr:hypothetical protein [Gemmataceae bacterium]